MKKRVAMYVEDADWRLVRFSALKAGMSAGEWVMAQVHELAQLKQGNTMPQVKQVPQKKVEEKRGVADSAPILGVEKHGVETKEKLEKLRESAVGIGVPFRSYSKSEQLGKR
jgi:hypothetical protein